jgi:hypothetical protein
VEIADVAVVIFMIIADVVVVVEIVVINVVQLVRVVQKEHKDALVRVVILVQ